MNECFYAFSFFLDSSYNVGNERSVDPMEQVTLKASQGLFSVEEIRLESEPENIYVLFVVINADGECDWSVGFTSLEDTDRIYTSVINYQIKKEVLTQALPILLNALEIKTIQNDSPEELAAHKAALREIMTIKL
jgi:hypothetical protein